MRRGYRSKSRSNPVPPSKNRSLDNFIQGKNNDNQISSKIKPVIKVPKENGFDPKVDYKVDKFVKISLSLDVPKQAWSKAVPVLNLSAMRMLQLFSLSAYRLRKNTYCFCSDSKLL